MCSILLYFSLLVSLHLLVCSASALLLALCFFTSLICALLCILFYFLLCSLFCFGFTSCSALCFTFCSALCIVLPSFIAFGLSTCGCLLAFGSACFKITLSLYLILSSLKKLLFVGNFFVFLLSRFIYSTYLLSWFSFTGIVPILLFTKDCSSFLLSWLSFFYGFSGCSSWQKVTKYLLYFYSRVYLSQEEVHY